MKRSTLFSVLLAWFVLFVLFEVGASPAPYDVRIKQILDRPYDLAQEIVRLEGKVIKFDDDVKAASTRVYVLQDNWGDEIKIITNKETLPGLDRRYLVTGMAFIDNTDKEKPEVKIFESSREDRADTLQGNTTQPVTPQKPKNEKLMNILFGAAAVLLVIIAILTVLMISGKYKENLTPGPGASSSFSRDSDSSLTGFPEPSKYIEDSSVRIAVPPEGTLKLLPGRLEIIGGQDQVKDIRFYKHPNQEETEFTFGRDQGSPYLHTQLKSPTVSPKHAKILWTNGKYMLINYSVTNPTKINGRTLDKDQSVTLEDNCIIEMGEVVFVFHEK